MKAEVPSLGTRISQSHLILQISASLQPVLTAKSAIVARCEGKEFWTRVGSVFENDNLAHPFTLLLNPGVAVGEKLIFSLPKAKEEAEAA
jgi:hypothetical protein